MIVVAVCRIPPEGVESFRAYEAAVLARTPLERRLVAADGTTEVHLLRFADQAAFAAFLAAPDRAAHRPLLEASGATVDVLTDLADAGP